MNLGKRILELRKKSGLTQNDLAEKLFVSYQAVSHWENGNANPDVSVLPKLAEIFGVTIDELFFERDSEVITKVDIKNVDEDALYIIVSEGGKLRDLLDFNKTVKTKEKIVIKLVGDVKNVNSHVSVEVDGDVKGDVNAGGGIVCGNAGGDVNAGGGIVCGNASGDVNAGGGINCGNVEGDVNAGGGINCGNIDGDAKAGGDITCGDIDGDVYCNNVSAEDIYGDIEAQEVKCKSVSEGKVNSKTIIVNDKTINI